MANSASGAFTKLHDLCNLAAQVELLERKTENAANRNYNAERNILQCPKESLATMQNLKNEVKNMSNDSLKVHSNLQLVTHRNQKLLQAGEKILEYLESEADKAEEYLKQKYGYVPIGPRSDSVLEISKCANRQKVAAGQANEQNVEPLVEKVQNENPTDEQEHDSLALLKSPEAPNFDGSKFKKDSLASPEAPSLQSKYQIDEFHLPAISAGNYHTIHPNKGEQKENIPHVTTEFFPQLPKSPSSPGIDHHKPTVTDGVLPSYHNKEIPTTTSNPLKSKFFDTPGGKGGSNASNHKWSSTNVLDAPYFAVLDQSPASPTSTVTNLGGFGNKNTAGSSDNTPISPEVDFKLHSRRSVLNEVPEQISSIDDDTVLLLRGGKIPVPALRTPDSPDLTEYRLFPKVNTKFDDDLPVTPPSPDLTSHFKHGGRDNDIKENMNPCFVDSSTKYQVKQTQYNDLPDYLKRVIPYQLSCECVEKVLNNTFPLHGDKYPRVMTQQRIEEVTSLGGKTKSFVFLMTALKIVKKISGTEYFEVLV